MNIPELSCSLFVGVFSLSILTYSTLKYLTQPQKKIKLPLEIAKSIRKAGKEAPGNLYEKVKEQWGVTQKAVENLRGEDNGNLFSGVLVAASSTLFVYGICKAVNYYKNS